MRSMWHQLVSLKYFYRHTTKIACWMLCLACLLLGIGSFSGLFLAPADYQQGDAFRIIYIHVPAAIMSMGIYAFMALCALVLLVWKIKLAEIFLKISVSLGLWMTFLALVTGSLWGKPMWGTAWIWDARLTSELILFFIYFAILALFSAIPDSGKAARTASIVVLLGALDLPIIHYSVYWWQTLHQGSTILQLAQPSMDKSMLYPLLLMIAGFLIYIFSLLIYRARTEILFRERNAQWVKHWAHKI